MDHQEQNRIAYLYQRHLEGRLTSGEQAEFDELLTGQDQRQLEQLIDSDWEHFREDELRELTESRKQEIFNNIILRPQTIRRSRWPRIVAAASILLVLGTGGYFLLKPKAIQQQTAQLVKNDVAPGGTQAILTLASGQKIVLNKQQGQIASQGKTSISLNAKGAINYQASANENANTEIYNTLTVPIGNHRDMTLADGTEVSLDAGSSITYPVAFIGAERKVSITGQAYFKVKHDATHPFHVKVKGLTIQDIGTEFNINAYDDEGGVKTTLVEGSVKVNSTLLKPGQQAIAVNDNITVKDADVEAVTAWRSNNFLFRDQNLKTTMAQIARWYNVTIKYDHAPQNLRIAADISRQHNLSVVLHAIEETGKVKFKIAGQTITVSQ